MDQTDEMATKRREAQNIIEQFRDASAAHVAGALTDEDYYAAQGRKVAALRVIALLDNGEEVSDELFLQMVEEAVDEAALPSDEELLRADVDYLLMIGGEL